MSTNTRNRTQAREVKKRPVHEIRMGRIRAAIWPNQTESGVRHNVTISRLYKDGDDWKDSTSFGRDDLPLVAQSLRPSSLVDLRAIARPAQPGQWRLAR